jgi:hypothetical protein
MHALTECNLLIIEWINIKQKLFTQFKRDHMQSLHEFSELRLINYTVIVYVNCTEFLRETRQEFFMLSKLEIEYCLEKDRKLELVFGISVLNRKLICLCSWHFLATKGRSRICGTSGWHYLGVNPSFKHWEIIWLELGISQALIILTKVKLLRLSLETGPVVDLCLK